MLFLAPAEKKAEQSQAAVVIIERRQKSIESNKNNQGSWKGVGQGKGGEGEVTGWPLRVASTEGSLSSLIG